MFWRVFFAINLTLSLICSYFFCALLFQSLPPLSNTAGAIHALISSSDSCRPTMAKLTL